MRCFASVCFPVVLSLAQESCSYVDPLRAICFGCWEASTAHLNKPVIMFAFVTMLDLHLGERCAETFVTFDKNVCLVVNFWILLCIVSQSKGFLQT